MRQWMTRLGLLMGMVPLAALSQPQVEVLSPLAGQCYNNGGVIFDGGVPGGEAQPPLRDIGATVRLSDAQGRPITLLAELFTPLASGRPPAPAACVLNNDCAATGGFCFPEGSCGCFLDDDCGAGRACVDNRCGCSGDAECGPGGRCLADGRCGCANAGACAAGQGCGLDGLCTCAGDGDCADDSVCYEGSCHFKSNLELYSAEATPPAGAAPFEDNSLRFGGDQVDDASPKILRVTARAGEQTARDQVLFQLDRENPKLLFEPQFLENLSGCDVAFDLAQNLPAQITDNQDPQPQLVGVEREVDGCTVSQAVQVADACGNAQVVTVETFTRPLPGAVTVDLAGFRCGLAGCEFTPDSRFEPNASVAKAALAYTVEAEAGCYNGVTATYQTAQEGAEVIIPGQALQTHPARILAPVGPYNLQDGTTLNLRVGDGPEQVVTFRAAEVRNINAVSTVEAIRIINAQADGLIAKVELGLLLETFRRGRGEQLTIVGGGAAFGMGLQAGQTASGSGDGPTTARVDIFACGDAAPVAQAQLDFTIIDRPVADAGGPYEGTQGDIIQLSAAGSFADPVDQGGIVEYAWDLDGDGAFDVIGDAAAAERVPFDTALFGDGEFRVLLRITAGNGTVEFDYGTVIVEDVSPTCDLGNDGLPYEGIEGLLVAFDASASAPGHPSDPIIAYDWNFGDGLFPQRGLNLSRTSHAFPNSGEYTVTLRVEDIDSFTECTRTVIIADVEPEIRSLGAFDPDNLWEGQPVRFFVEAVPGSPSDPIQEINWNFGDGSQPLEGIHRNPTHTYLDDTEHRPGGPYEVCVQVADEDDQIEQCFQVRIRDLQPEVNFVGQTVGNEGDVFTFDATNTIAGGPADPLRRLTFDFGDGSPPVVINNVNDPVARRVSHRFLRSSATAQDPNARFQVTLTAEDEDSAAVASLDVLVRDVQPTARARVVFEDPEQVGYEGVPLGFDASASQAGSDTDPIVSYVWDFGDGSDPVETAEPIISHAFPNQGLYIVTVFVIDSDGSRVSTSLTATIRNVPPTNARILGDAQVEIGEQARFTAAYDDVPADLIPHRISWTVDGEVVSNDLALVYAFPAIGRYQIGVEVFDEPDADGGGSASATFTVEVTPAAPRIQDLGQLTGREGQRLTFSVAITPAPLDNEGGLDAPVRVLIGPVPPGATWELVEEDRNGVPTVIVQAEWTPTYYDAGDHVFRVRAEGRINETSRTRDVAIRISEAGTPLLAAASGTGRRGQVTLYEYGLSAGTITFQARSRVDVGVGVGGLTQSANGQRVFVAVEGSGVAVVGTREGALLRTVPTGPGTRSVVAGDDYIWALNSQARTLSAIDADTLKIESVISLAPMTRPSDLVWIPAGVAGLDQPRLAIIGAGTGDLGLVDPEAALEGRAGFVSRGILGGNLSRIALDHVTGDLYVSDAKTRRVYQVDLAEHVRRPDRLDAAGIPFTFAPFDILANNGVLWAGTESGLVRIEGADETVSSALQARGLGLLPPGILTGGTLVISTANRVENLDGRLNRIVDSAGGRVRRLSAFVALE